MKTLHELLQRKKELEEQRFNLTKAGRIDKVNDILIEFKKVKDEILSLLDNERLNSGSDDSSIIYLSLENSEIALSYPKSNIEAQISMWFFNEGDEFEDGDIIALVETKFGIMLIDVYHDGIIEKILAPEGQNSIKVNSPIAILNTKYNENRTLKLTTDENSYFYFSYLNSDIKAKLSKWLVKEGGKVECYSDIAVIEIEGETFELSSHYDGIIEKIFVQEGEEFVKVNSTIASMSRMDEKLSKTENKDKQDLQDDDPTFLEKIPKVINQTADNISDAYHVAYSKICVDCDFKFIAQDSESAQICTNCGSTSQASKRRVANTGQGILASIGAVIIGSLGVFLGPFAIIAWFISFILGFYGICMWFSFIGFFVLPIYWKICWFLACIISKRGTIINYHLTRNMYLIIILIVFLIFFINQSL